jgi:TusA-related sulfurtransferase
MATNSDQVSSRFESISQLDVPKGRDGKHKQIVVQLLSDIEQLEPGSALKVPLTALPDTKENIRSALNRATNQRGIHVATSSDTEFLYVWKVDPES